MPRSGTTTIIKGKEKQDTRKSYCMKCEEKYGKLNKLIPRIIDNGSIDEAFKMCMFCKELYPIHEIKWESEYEPKGYLNPNNSPFDNGTRVKAIKEKRITKANKKEGIEQIEIPKLGNEPDLELEEEMKMKERPAILNYLNDDLMDYFAEY